MLFLVGFLLCFFVCLVCCHLGLVFFVQFLCFGVGFLLFFFQDWNFFSSLGKKQLPSRCTSYSKILPPSTSTENCIVDCYFLISPTRLERHDFQCEISKMKLGILIASLAVITLQDIELVNHISKHGNTSINVLLETNQGQAYSVTFCQLYFE